MLRIAIVERLTVDDVALFDGNSRAGQHADLLRFVVVDARLVTDCVQVVLREGFLFHGSLSSDRAFIARLAKSIGHQLSDAIQIPRDQLHASVSERGAAGIGESDPPIEIR